MQDSGHSIFQSSPLCTRRAFLSATAIVGALHFLGIELSPGKATVAYADEAGNQHFVVYVLNNEEVPIIATDVFRGRNLPVEDMEITLTSVSNGKTVTVYTDEAGCAVANVRALCDEADEDDAQHYGGYVSIHAEKKGYLIYEEESRLVQTAMTPNSQGIMPNVVQVPTQSYNGRAPYLSRVCFDGADVQYVANTVELIAENDAQHTLDITLENADFYDSQWDENWIFELLTGTEIIASVKAKREGTRVAAQLSGQWLDGKHGIVPGTKLQLRFNPETSAFGGLLRFPLTFVEGRLAFENGLSENQELSVGQENTAENGKTDPPYSNAFTWFVRANDSFSQGVPFFPIKIFTDKAANFGMSVTLLSADIYKYADGKGGWVEPEDRWKKFSDMSWGSWFDTFVNNFEKNLGRWTDLTNRTNPDGSAKEFGASKLTTSLTAKFSVEATALAKVDDYQAKEWHWHGDIGGLADFRIDFATSQQLMIVGFPCYWTFDVSAFAQLKLLLGIQFDQLFSNIHMGHELWGDFPFPLTGLFILSAEAGLGAGLGIVGVLSAGVRGFGNLTLTVNADNTDAKQAYANKPWPHVTLVGKANIEAILQALLFKKTIQLTNWGPWTLCDSWDKKDELSTGSRLGQRVGTNTLPTSRFGTVAAQLQSGENAAGLEMVPEADLSDCIEFAGTLTDEGTAAFSYSRQAAFKRLAAANIQDPYAGAPAVVSTKECGPLRSQNDSLLQGVQGYNPMRGVRPTLSTLLWSDIFSAPRARTLTVGNKTYLLRISMVEMLINDNDTNLEVVQSANGCLFFQAKEGNKLPVVALSQDGSSVEYPVCSDGTVMATLDQMGNDNLSSTLTPEQLVAACASQNDNSVKPVIIKKVVRSRLTISTLEGTTWSEPTVIDFALPLTARRHLRQNTWDVDFHAIATPEGAIYIGLSSIVRPDDSTSFSDQFDNQFLSLIRFDTSTNKVTDAKCDILSMICGYTCWNPRVTVHKLDGKDALTMLYYRKDTDGNVALAYNYYTVVADGYMWPGKKASANIVLPTSFVQSHLTEGCFEVSSAAPDGSEDGQVLAISWSCPAVSSETPSLGSALSAFGGSEADGVQSHDAMSVVWATGLTSGRLLSPEAVTQLEGVESITLGAASTAGSAYKVNYLYSITDKIGAERTLHRLGLTVSNRQATFKDVFPVGHLRTALRFFANSDGTRLYAARAMEGRAPELPDDALDAIEGNAVLQGTIGNLNSSAASLENASTQGYSNNDQVQLFQLLCACYNKELDSYLDFFPLAEIDFAPDILLEAIIPGTNRFDFVAGTITDGDRNLMDVYHVAVPRVVGMQLEGAASVSHFGMPGGKTAFQVLVSNTGNVPLTGFDVTVSRADTGSEIEKLELRELAGIALETEDYMRPVYDENGRPTGKYEMTEDAAVNLGLLWPGKTRAYRALFTIPEDIETGQAEFQVAIANPVPSNEYLTADELAALSAAATSNTLVSVTATTTLADNEENSVDNALVCCVDPRARLANAAVASNAYVDITRIPADYETTEGFLDNPHDPDDEKEPSSGSNKDPKTGDSIGSIAIPALAGVAALAGAGVALARHKGKDQDEDK